jgi:hypothetical protein
MMIHQKNYFKQFNDKYFLFLEFVKSHMSKNKQFTSFYFKNKLMKKTNIKYFIRTWYTCITNKHYNDISTKDASYFLTKDYSDDKLNTGTEYVNSFDMIIDTLKGMYTTLDKVIVNEFMDYVKSLTQLSYMYFNINN